ncbi:hypothetical protein SB49_00675 [Sediminicola sp. YIK13]|uniref:hypothetical protein n=1 Tax=Sediminicola sp. YIK13 TaxID=1453352 RepID=UPI000721062B|nr:hypothetical protein [Sediminicola sp. YIK13]ALM06490.1 hypothetical protein SB49_00675 [Sediminicola sp. YIK13]
MKTLLILSLGLMMTSLVSAQEVKTEILPKDIQIKTAVIPAPDQKKSGAMVYGYDADGKFTVLREGSNNLVCIADNPNQEGISVACYSVQLEPFMKRGRELGAEGMDAKEKFDIRGAEVAAGKLMMPKDPSMLYIYYGSEEAYDKASGTLSDGKFRYVVYIPFATVESTGLPDKPHAPGMPWLMDPGTYRAHIMIGPF